MAQRFRFLGLRAGFLGRPPALLKPLRLRNDENVLIAHALTHHLLFRPLLLAAQSGHVACLRPLLAAGADPRAADNHGGTPAHFAALSGDVDCLAALIDADPGVVELTRPNGEAVRSLGCALASFVAPAAM